VGSGSEVDSDFRLWPGAGDAERDAGGEGGRVGGNGASRLLRICGRRGVRRAERCGCERGITSRFLSSCSRVHLLGARGERGWRRLAKIHTDAWVYGRRTRRGWGYLTETGACSVDGNGLRSRGRANNQSRDGRAV